MQNLKIIFAGTPSLSATILQEILNQYSVDMVITQPDRPSGRGKKINISPVKDLALANNIEIFQPQSLKQNPDAIQKIKDMAPDIIIVVAYGLILPKEFLEIPRLGCVNIHVSLLPKYRGAAPIQRAIIAGESASGITIIQMDEGLDTGNILMQQAIPIAHDETSGSLHNKLAQLGSQMIVNYLTNYTTIVGIIQPSLNVSYAQKIDKSEAKINWQEDALIISRKIRGLNPTPGCFSTLNEHMVKIWQATVGNNVNNKNYGTILECTKDSIKVVCGNNSTLIIKEIQESGKNRLSITQYLLGHPDLIGKVFSCE